MNTGLLRHAVATALTVYGIETLESESPDIFKLLVATALTVYGIETPSQSLSTSDKDITGCNSTYRLRY